MEETRMRYPHRFLLVLLLSMLPLVVQAQQAKPIGFPDAPGRDVTLRLCFQCHGDGMWRDYREDRRGWEGALYRMVGRGALWTEDEINTMAGYLAAIYGPQAGKAAQ
jgi:hypothetical protein